MNLIYLNENDETMCQPIGFKNINLFPHQLTLLRKCIEL